MGNSLAVRISAKIARSAHLHVGTPVELTVQENLASTSCKNSSLETRSQRSIRNGLRAIESNYRAC